MPIATTLLRVTISFGALYAMAGCNPSGLETHAVTGRVVFKGGDVKQLSASSVEFASETQPDVHAYGQIQPDGSFRMSTQAGGVGADGVVPGKHKIRILYAASEDDDHSQKAPINARYASFEKSGLSWDVPSNEELVIEVAK